eukprot:12173258-Heterocapsa_arctica.AAC.1
MEQGASLSMSISMPWSVVSSRADFMAKPSRLTVSDKKQLLDPRPSSKGALHLPGEQQHLPGRPA